MATRRLVSQAEAADYSSVTVKTIRRYVAAGRLTGYRLGDRLIRIDLDELEAMFSPIPTGRPRPPAA